MPGNSKSDNPNMADHLSSNWQSGSITKMSGPSAEAKKRYKRAASEIADELAEWVFESADSIAESHSIQKLQGSQDGRESLFESLAREIYFSAEQEIIAILEENGFAEYLDDVESVCIQELTDTFRVSVGEISGPFMSKEGVIELAIQDEASSSRKVLKAAVYATLAYSDELAAMRVAEAERKKRMRAEQRRLRAEMLSRSWFARIKDFFGM